MCTEKVIKLPCLHPHILLHKRGSGIYLAFDILVVERINVIISARRGMCEQDKELETFIT